MLHLGVRLPDSFAERFDGTFARDLATRAHALDPSFDADAFVAHVGPQLEGAALKARIAMLADGLAAGLSSRGSPLLPSRTDLLVALAGPPADPDRPESADLAAWPVLSVVERHGGADPEPALDALHQLTRRFSAEFAIRPYLRDHPEPTWDRLAAWARDPSGHVRRLVSEGTRPRLPWAMRVPALVDDPEPGLALLDALVDDPLHNVRNSVANHLNDVSKDHPDRAVEVARRWSRPGDARRERVVRQGLRGLIKAGHPGALEVFGVAPELPCIVDLDLPEAVTWGDTLRLVARVRSDADAEAPFVVDFVVSFPSASGRGRRKTFKGRLVQLAPGQTADVPLSIPMVPRSTRPLVPGPHDVVVQVNGAARSAASFELLPPRP